MQSVCVNFDKSLETANLLSSAYTEIHTDCLYSESSQSEREVQIPTQIIMQSQRDNNLTEKNDTTSRQTVELRPLLQTNYDHHCKLSQTDHIILAICLLLSIRRQLFAHICQSV